MHANCGIQVRIVRRHHDGHRPASGQTGNVDAVGIDAVGAHNLTRDARDNRRLTALALLIARLKPVPAVRAVGRCHLLRVDHKTAMFLCQRVHASASGKVLRILLAAMQHHDERHRLFRVTARHVQAIATRARAVGHAATEESSLSGISRCD